MPLFVIPAEAGIQKYEKENLQWVDLCEAYTDSPGFLLPAFAGTGSAGMTFSPRFLYPYLLPAIGLRRHRLRGQRL